MKLKRIALLMLLVLVASVIAACGGDDDDGGDSGDSGNSGGTELSESFSTEGGFSVNHPSGWAAQGDDLEGVTLASNESALTEFNESDVPNFEAVDSGSVIINMQALPFPVDMGTPSEIFGMMTGEVSEDDPFTPGEPTDVTVGDIEGVRAPLNFGEAVQGEGNGNMYILRADDNSLLLAIVVAAGDIDNGLVESILATVSVPAVEGAEG